MRKSSRLITLMATRVRELILSRFGLLLDNGCASKLSIYRTITLAQLRQNENHCVAFPGGGHGLPWRMSNVWRMVYHCAVVIIVGVLVAVLVLNIPLHFSSRHEHDPCKERNTSCGHDCVGNTPAAFIVATCIIPGVETCAHPPRRQEHPP